MKNVLIGIGVVLLVIIFAGIYKFNFLTNQAGYDVDGNKTAETSEYYDNGENPAKISQNIRSVSPTEFKNLADSGKYVLIDVRTPEELLPQNAGIIYKNALNIDFYKPDFRENLAKLDPNDKYLIYCHSGNRSGKTLKIMKEIGFKNVADLAGGKNAWDQTFPQKTENTAPVICTEDAKICADGSSVSRIVPNCEFAKCPTPKLPEDPVPLVDENPAKKVISLEEVAQHKSKDDCWTAINGKVYDVTAFFGKHPGGDRNLYRVCGIDATEAFEAKHGYNSKAISTLESFYIDNLN